MTDSHQKAAEYLNLAAQAHRTAAAHHEKGDHQTGHEHSRQALEHSRRAYELAQEAHTESERETATSANSACGASDSSHKPGSGESAGTP